MKLWIGGARASPGLCCCQMSPAGSGNSGQTLLCSCLGQQLWAQCPRHSPGLSQRLWKLQLLWSFLPFRLRAHSTAKQQPQAQPVWMLGPQEGHSRRSGFPLAETVPCLQLFAFSYISCSQQIPWIEQSLQHLHDLISSSKCSSRMAEHLLHKDTDEVGTLQKTRQSKPQIIRVQWAS